MAKQGAGVTSNDTFALTALSVIGLDRSRRRWRLLAVLLLVLASMATCNWMGDWKDEIAPGPHIAVVNIEGMITDDAYTRQVIEQLADEKDVKAVIVNVDSPGGTMVGGIRLYDALRTVAVKKPVAAVMGTLAASAGYMVSLAGDKIYANPATLTGSIGVLMPLVDATGLADKIGIKEDAFTSGDLKEVTSPLASRNAHARAYLQELVMRMDEVFMAMVKSRRPNLSAATLRTISDGRALAGVQALDMKLVDALGGEADAQKWLSAQAKSKGLLELRDYDLTEEKGWLGRAVEGQLNLGGLMGRLANLARTNLAVMALAR